MNMHQLSVIRYLPILGFALLMLWLLFKKWDFIKETLSEAKDGKITGSATRLGGMILIVVVAFNETYTTIKTQAFDYKHLVAILISIGVLFGFIKIVDLFSIWKGGKLAPEQPAQAAQPMVTTTTTTEVTQ